MSESLWHESMCVLTYSTFLDAAIEVDSLKTHEVRDDVAARDAGRNLI